MTDEFYTKHPEQFKSVIEKYIGSDDALIEPSCGDGAFLKMFDFDYAYDIVEKTDSLSFELKDFLTTKLNIDIPANSIYIGNPPFGKNSKLAIEFCKHCCDLDAKFIMFILPVIFKNETYQNKAFNIYYHLIESIDYNEFVKDGVDVKVECVFQIWQKQTTPRTITTQPATKPKFFSYIPRSKVKQLQSADNTNNINNERIFSIRRVGSTTPQLTKGVHESLEDHYIIKLNEDVDINSFVQSYNSYNFTLSPSTKQKHITQQQLNQQINQLDIKLISSNYNIQNTF